MPIQTYRLTYIWLSLGWFGLLACQFEGSPQEKNKLPPPSKPINILWLVAEDMGPYLPAFGDSTVPTPNLSRLAQEGVRYTHVFSPSGVCSPSRAAIATGMYPTSIGANHMRTNKYMEVTGLPAYEALPPPELRMFNQLLRQAGYYCTNNAKQDYQFKAPVTAWDESSPYAHWRNRAQTQPFFAMFTFTVTHESGLFEPYGIRLDERRHYRSGDTTVKLSGWNVKTEAGDTPVHLSPDTDFSIPPYLPDTETVRKDLWKMYNNIVEMDKQVGAILAQLEADGLLEETIIFFFADHGGPLPRQKRLIYDAGLRVPLLVRFPDKRRAGTIDGQLLSFVDLAPTVLSLAGQDLPDYLPGRSFIQPQTPERRYIHAAADRFDGFTDVIRAVRDKRYKYIRNYRPEQGYYLPVTYREQIPTMQELLRLRDLGALKEAQAQWFRAQKPAEELFDCQNDPHELHNLAKDPKYQDKLKELSAEMDRWLEQIGDKPGLPERELITQLWGGQDTQPITAKPGISYQDDKIKLSCSTEGASIGYKQKGAPSWEIYQEAVGLPKGTKLLIKAHRIGFKPSKTIEYIVPD